MSGARGAFPSWAAEANGASATGEGADGSRDPPNRWPARSATSASSAIAATPHGRTDAALRCGAAKNGSGSNRRAAAVAEARARREQGSASGADRVRDCGAAFGAIAPRRRRGAVRAGPGGRSGGHAAKANDRANASYRGFLPSWCSAVRCARGVYCVCLPVGWEICSTVFSARLSSFASRTMSACEMMPTKTPRSSTTGTRRTCSRPMSVHDVVH